MLKQASKKPMKPLPEMEMCQYEKIREDIINERKDAMAKFGFYEVLEKTKQKVLFTSKDQKSFKKKGKIKVSYQRKKIMRKK